MIIEVSWELEATQPCTLFGSTVNTGDRYIVPVLTIEERELMATRDSLGRLQAMNEQAAMRAFGQIQQQSLGDQQMLTSAVQRGAEHGFFHGYADMAKTPVERVSGKYSDVEKQRIEKTLEIAYRIAYYRPPKKIMWLGHEEQAEYLRGRKSQEDLKTDGWLRGQVANWFVWNHEVLVIIARPLWVKRDQLGRIHCENGPAIKWANGHEEYYWKDRSVERRVIMTPHRVGIKAIKSETNAELKRLLTEKYCEHHGYQKFLTAMGAEWRHEDETGVLWAVREREKNTWNDGIAYCVVEVINSTPEPDGSFNRYYLKVPPDMKRAREAVAWGFEMGEKEYKPVMET